MKVLQIDHVQLAMPPESESRARGFYCDVLGMKEIPKPAALAGGGGCWFTSGAAKVRLGVEEDFFQPRKRILRSLWKAWTKFWPDAKLRGCHPNWMRELTGAAACMCSTLSGIASS